MELCSSSENQQIATASVEFPAAALENIIQVKFRDVCGISKNAEPITLSLSLPPPTDSENALFGNPLEQAEAAEGEKSPRAMSSAQGMSQPTMVQPEKSDEAAPSPPKTTPQAPVNAPAVVGGTGLQIVTRKRSAAAGSLASLPAPGVSGEKETPSNNSQVSTTGNLPEKKSSVSEQPAKKKKKYTPKSKKTPTANDNAGSSTANVVTPAPAPPAKATPPKSKKSSSSKSKSKKQSSSSSKSSKSKKQTPQSQQLAPCGVLGSENYQSQSGIGVGVEHHQLDTFTKPPPPPPLQPMPKLTRMPVRSESNDATHATMGIGLVKIKQELPDWDECGSEVVDEPCIDKNPGSGSTSSRKKKSKGRNGNIYIGVFNRIEWMKLQDAFGFTTVNNFGTFVLETMRRVHGDIKFWCDLATASGIYPDLAKYEWKNGFPHAVNQEGKIFTPELDPDLSEERKADVVELGKRLWEQRLQQLKLQQQLRVGEGEGALQIAPEEVEVDEEEDETEDTTGLGNYLDTMEKLGCGRYSPPGIILNTDELSTVGTGMEVKLTEEQIASIWNEQLANAQNLERFGEIFNFINSIDQEERGLVQKQLMESVPLDQQDSDTDGNDGMAEIEAAALM